MTSADGGDLPIRDLFAPSAGGPTVLPSWFESHVGLEEAASRIRTFEIQFVPGLLQTEDYARAATLSRHRAVVWPATQPRPGRDDGWGGHVRLLKLGSLAQPAG